MLGDITLNIGLDKAGQSFVENAFDAMLPGRKVTRALAEAEAARIKADAVNDIEYKNMLARQFREAEEIKHIENIVKILIKARDNFESIEQLQNIETDWRDNYLSKAKLISDDDMQILWGRVLAREASQRGSFSRKTVNILDDLDKRDADLFTKICGYTIFLGQIPHLFIYNHEHSIYSNINEAKIEHLMALGLVNYSKGIYSGATYTPPTSSIPVPYFEQILEFSVPASGEINLHHGSVNFTQAGKELFPICGASPVCGFADYIKENIVK